MIELLTQVKGVTAGTDTTLTLRFGRLMFLVFGADFTETVYSKSSGARGRQILLKQTSAVVTVDIVTVIVLITISNHILMAMWKHAILGSNQSNVLKVAKRLLSQRRSWLLIPLSSAWGSRWTLKKRFSLLYNLLPLVNAPTLVAVGGSSIYFQYQNISTPKALDFPMPLWRLSNFGDYGFEGLQVASSDH